MSNQEVELGFGKNQLVLKISILENSAMSLAGVESKDDKTVILKLATPQFSAQPVSEIEASWIENFHESKSLKADISAKGYSVEFQEKKLTQGRLFYWMTPTFGSSNFYYLTPPNRPTVAVRIGPVAGTLDHDISIDWEHARWTIA
jgi:hypothetical protein